MQTTNAKQEWVTMAEAMWLLDCSRSTVDRLRKTRQITSARRFGRVLVSRESIRKFIESTLTAW